MNKITNKERAIKKAEEMGFQLGCYTKKLNDATYPMMKKVLEGMEWEEDTDISIKRVPHVVEIDRVDNEIDLVVITKREYIDRYGNDRYEDD